MERIANSQTVEPKAYTRAERAKTKRQEPEFGNMLAGAIAAETAWQMIPTDMPGESGEPETATGGISGESAATGTTVWTMSQEADPNAMAATAAMMAFTEGAPATTTTASDAQTLLNVRPPAAPIQTQAVTEELYIQTGQSQPSGDIIAAQASQTTETVQRQPVTQQDTDPAQTRFDEMLARAAQELGQGETPVIPSADEPQPLIDPAGTVDDPADVPDMETMPDDIPIAEEQEPQTAPRTTVITGDTVPRTEQRPLKEMSKADEAVLGIVQQTAQQERPLQIAQAPEPEQPTANPVEIPRQAEQIRAQVLENVERGETEFRMQLNPEELGRIDVKLVMGSGRLALEIIAANSRSAELLSKQAEGLIASLRLNNIDVSSVNIVYGSTSASSHMDGGFSLLTDSQASAQQDSQTDGRQEQSRAARDNGGTPEETRPAQNGQMPQRLLNYAV